MECKNCKRCVFNGSDALCCAAMDLRIAWYELVKELPIIGRYVPDEIECNNFSKEE